MDSLKQADLVIHASEEGSTARLVWSGKSGEVDPASFLNPYFENVIKEAKTKSLSLRLDFTGLEYMNSSTVPPVIRALTSMNAEGVAGELLYKKDLKWQVASFRALENVVKIQNFQTIQVKGV